MSYTRLRYHFVFATKDRKPLIDTTVEEKLYPLVRNISEELGGCTLAVGGTADHIHTITATPPTIAVSKFLRDLKSRTSGEIKRCIPELSQFSWQVGFGGFTLNPHEMNDIFSYVVNQKNHHENGTLREAYEKITEDETSTVTGDKTSTETDDVPATTRSDERS